MVLLSISPLYHRCRRQLLGHSPRCVCKFRLKCLENIEKWQKGAKESADVFFFFIILRFLRRKP